MAYRDAHLLLESHCAQPTAPGGTSRARRDQMERRCRRLSFLGLAIASVAGTLILHPRAALAEFVFMGTRPMHGRPVIPEPVRLAASWVTTAMTESITRPSTHLCKVSR